MAHVFGATDLWAALGITGGNTADFEIQETTIDEQSSDAVTRTKVGEYVAASHKQFDIRTERTFLVQASTIDGSTLTFNLGGAGTSGVVITRAEVRQTNNGHAQMTLTAHDHDGTTTHAGTEYEYTTPSMGFGVLAVKLNGTLADAQSARETVEVGHVDRLNNAGAHLVGRSFGVMFDYEEVYLSQGTAPSPSASFKSPLVRTRAPNTDFNEYTVTAKSYA